MNTAASPLLQPLRASLAAIAQSTDARALRAHLEGQALPIVGGDAEPAELILRALGESPDPPRLATDLAPPLAQVISECMAELRAEGLTPVLRLLLHQALRLAADLPANAVLAGSLRDLAASLEEADPDFWFQAPLAPLMARTLVYQQTDAQTEPLWIRLLETSGEGPWTPERRTVLLSAWRGLLHVPPSEEVTRAGRVIDMGRVERGLLALEAGVWSRERGPRLARQALRILKEIFPRSPNFWEDRLKGLLGRWPMGLRKETWRQWPGLERVTAPTSAMRHPLSFRPPRRGRSELLQTMFEARVEIEPDNIALVWQNQKITYTELDRAANRLAHHLREFGVGPEAIVGLCLERSPRLVEAVLAVLKAGGAYLPLNPDHPAERLALLLSDLAVPVIVTESATAKSLPATSASVLLLDDREAAKAIAARSDERPTPIGTLPSNLAYVIYVSDSRGIPKGVGVTHANVARLFDSTDDWFRFDEHDTWALVHSYDSDLSALEIWGALLHGGRLVVVPRDVAQSPENFLKLACRDKVTILIQTSSDFTALLQADQQQEVPAHWRDLPLSALRWMILSGEALNPEIFKLWVNRYGDPTYQNPRLVNLYGTTETTIHVAHRPLTAADLEVGNLIVRPIPDMQVFVLGQRMEPLPAGMPGEISVGGAGLARGYLGRPALTAERFVPDPSSQKPGARLYRTGDLARQLLNGSLEYAGRADRQANIRGFRIEPGEIEDVLVRHPSVRYAFVTPLEYRSGSRCLVAYLVPDTRDDGGMAAVSGNPSQLIGDIRGHAAKRLPEHMVPSVWFVLGALPLTADGKVDRQALPVPDDAKNEGRPFVGPRNSVELKLMAIWRAVLSLDRISVYDNFFELGGHSLLMVQLASLIRTTFDVETPLRILVDATNLEEMAEFIAQQMDQIELERVLVEVEGLSTEEIRALLETEGFRED